MTTRTAHSSVHGHALPASESMGVLEAIHARRAVRDYLPTPVSRQAIATLLRAAVSAPTAMHEEPWAFLVVQDAAALHELSRDVLSQVEAEAPQTGPQTGYRGALARWAGEAHADVFHGAGTLIVICSRSSGRFAAADCWLAAQNLMLAACTMDLGTCVIGMAVDTLNGAKWRERFSLAPEITAVAPIVVGTPAAKSGPLQRKGPVIIRWKAEPSDI